MNQHVTEILLELGLKDRIAGTAYLDDKVLPKYKKAYESTPVIAKEYPSYEKLLAANPDFVYGGYASAFAAGDGRSRDALAKSGIKTRLNIEGCAKKPVTMDDVYREVREAGATFGVKDRAEKWVRGAEAELARTAEKSKGGERPAVFVYDSGDKTAAELAEQLRDLEAAKQDIAKAQEKQAEASKTAETKPAEAAAHEGPSGRETKRRGRGRGSRRRAVGWISRLQAKERGSSTCSMSRATPRSAAG